MQGTRGFAGPIPAPQYSILRIGVALTARHALITCEKRTSHRVLDACAGDLVVTAASFAAAEVGHDCEPSEDQESAEIEPDALDI